MAFLDALRQLRFPGEFRVAAPSNGEDITALLERVSGLLASRAAEPTKQVAPQKGEREHQKFLAELATGMWRLRARMVDPQTGRPIEEMRRAYRHCEAVWDLLANARVRVQDHTGEDYDSGRSLKALAFESRPGLRRERVVETIKPSIFVGDEFVQMGEVIVGTPESGSE